MSVKHHHLSCWGLAGIVAAIVMLPGAVRADDVLRFRVSASASGGRLYDYLKLSRASRTVQAGDCVEYDVYINNSSAGVGGIDIKNTDGSYWRDAPDWQDQYGMSGHPVTNLAGKAYGGGAIGSYRRRPL